MSNSEKKPCRSKDEPEDSDNEKRNNIEKPDEDTSKDSEEDDLKAFIAYQLARRGNIEKPDEHTLKDSEEKDESGPCLPCTLEKTVDIDKPDEHTLKDSEEKDESEPCLPCTLEKSVNIEKPEDTLKDYEEKDKSEPCLPCTLEKTVNIEKPEEHTLKDSEKKDESEPCIPCTLEKTVNIEKPDEHTLKDSEEKDESEPCIPSTLEKTVHIEKPDEHTLKDSEEKDGSEPLDETNNIEVADEETKDKTYIPKGFYNSLLSVDPDIPEKVDDAKDDVESVESIRISQLSLPKVLREISEIFTEGRQDTSQKYGPLIGAIDEGTSSTRFLVFASKTAEVLTYHQVEIPSIVPQEGWFEQDPKVILHAVKETIKVTCDNLDKLNIDVGEIAAIGITNQRETTILWDRFTGKPLYNAIVWMDTRTHTTVDEILKYGMRNQYFLQQACGLPVSTYFSALKIKWLMDNVPAVKTAIDEEKCLFGTIDTWIIWNLTGGFNGGIHITDVTNASRTMLMNIETLQWDPKLCEVFGIPMSILPEIRSSSEIYGCIFMEGILDGVPISGILGDQHAALVGQMCFKNGQAKCTYGTGCFILYNTGQRRVISSHGLLTTVAYQFGPKAKPLYALEGSVAIAGIGIKWLRDNLEILKDASESTELAQSAGTEGEVVFVPAFSGLYAPYWRQDARSVICGLTEETKPGHLVKAALEAVCFQVRDVLEAMTLDCSVPLNKMLVDGGMTVNDYLMQMQADYCGIPVVRPTLTETTSFGAALAAGIAEGIAVWEIDKLLPVPCDTFQPQISEDLRDIKFSKWKLGIERSLGWVKTGGVVNEIKEKIVAAAPAGLFLIGAAAIMVLSEYFRRSFR